MSFRLWTIFYVFALVAAALATFGGWGAVAAAIVVWFWAWVFYVRKSHKNLIGCLAALSMLAVLLIVMFLPAVQSAVEAARSFQCMSQLTQIAIARHNYHDTKVALPPPYLANDNGKPMASWRVLILPYLEESALYNLMDLAKPWDDPRNARASSSIIENYRCPSHYSRTPTTDYMAVVGPHTAFPMAGGRKISDFKDGTAKTVVLIETGGKDIHWAEPRDLSVAEAVDLLSQSSEVDEVHRINHGFFYKPSAGRNVAFADGYVRCLRAPLDRETAEALLTVDGGEDIDTAVLQKSLQPQLDYPKIYGFALFTILALLPIAWVRTAAATTPLYLDERGHIV